MLVGRSSTSPVLIWFIFFFFTLRCVFLFFLLLKIDLGGKASDKPYRYDRLQWL